MNLSCLTHSSKNEPDLFHSTAWFDNLLARGFVAPPEHLPVCWEGAHGAVCLHLMRAVGASAGLESLANYYSGLFGPQGPVDRLTADDWGALAGQFRSLGRGGVVQLQPLDADSAWLPGLEAGLRRCGYWTDRFFCFGNWYQSVPEGGFTAYWAERPSALRNTVERARRRLDKTGDWRFEVITGESPAAALDMAINAYVSVYNQSWKVPEPRSDFMPSLMRLAAGQGWLRLGMVWVAGEPVAAQVWLVAGRKANIFKLAYVKGQEKLSAGSVLTAELMRHVMDVDQVQEVDFLSGDDPYKADWMALRRERIGLVAFDKRHWRGWLALLRHQLGRWRRSWRAAGE